MLTTTTPGVLPVLDARTRATCDVVADRLEAEQYDLAASMTDAVFREVPIYAGRTTPDMHAAVLEHSLDHARAVVRSIRTWCLPSTEELTFVRERAALRASQQLPLSALLHSYRIGHRTVWERLVGLLDHQGGELDAVLALTTLTLSYTDLISGALAEGYVEGQKRQLIELDRVRRDLLENLLQGVSVQQVETHRLASTFDLVPGGEFLVSVLTGLGSEGAASLTRAADSLRRHLSVVMAQPFVVVRHQEVVAVASLTRAKPAALVRVVRQAHAELLERNERWAAGVSTLCIGLAEIARGYEEAHRALDLAARNAGVTALLEMPVSDYLFERADATAVRMIPPAGRRLFESTVAADRVLVETLVAYARADMAVRLAAERLSVHPNTVIYRLEKIERLLGRDPTRFSDLVEILAWERLVGGR